MAARKHVFRLGLGGGGNKTTSGRQSSSPGQAVGPAAVTSGSEGVNKSRHETPQSANISGNSQSQGQGRRAPPAQGRPSNMQGVSQSPSTVPDHSQSRTVIQSQVQGRPVTLGPSGVRGISQAPKTKTHTPRTERQPSGRSARSPAGHRHSKGVTGGHPRGQPTATSGGGPLQQDNNSTTADVNQGQQGRGQQGQGQQSRGQQGQGQQGRGQQGQGQQGRGQQGQGHQTVGSSGGEPQAPRQTATGNHGQNSGHQGTNGNLALTQGTSHHNGTSVTQGRSRSNVTTPPGASTSGNSRSTVSIPSANLPPAVRTALTISQPRSGVTGKSKAKFKTNVHISRPGGPQTTAANNAGKTGVSGEEEPRAAENIPTLSEDPSEGAGSSAQQQTRLLQASSPQPRGTGSAESAGSGHRVPLNPSTSSGKVAQRGAPNTRSANVATRGAPTTSTSSGNVTSRGDPTTSAGSNNVATRGAPSTNAGSNNATTRGAPSSSTSSGNVTSRGDPTTSAGSNNATTRGAPTTSAGSNNATTRGAPSTNAGSNNATTRGAPSSSNSSGNVTSRGAPTTSASSGNVTSRGAPSSSTSSGNVTSRGAPTTSTSSGNVTSRGAPTTSAGSTNVATRGAPSTSASSGNVTSRGAPTTSASSSNASVTARTSEVSVASALSPSSEPRRQYQSRIQIQQATASSSPPVIAIAPNPGSRPISTVSDAIIGISDERQLIERPNLNLDVLNSRGHDNGLAPQSPLQNTPGGLNSGPGQNRTGPTEALPDILNSHLLPPYTPRQNQHRTPRSGGQGRGRGARASRQRPPHPTTQLEGENKPCCSHDCCVCCVTVITTFRWVLVSLAMLGVCCVVTGIILGALHMTVGSSFLTLSLMFIGLGVMLVVVVGVGWRCTPPGHEPCHLLFNLGEHSHNNPGHPRPVRSHRHRHWHGGSLYPEFRFRRPPPSYNASMQEYRQQLALAQLQINAPADGAIAAHDDQVEGADEAETSDNYSLPSSPPPTYRSHASTVRPGLHITFPPTQGGDYPTSHPPTYRSHVPRSEARPSLPLEGREDSQGHQDNAVCVDAIQLQEDSMSGHQWAAPDGVDPAGASSTLHRVRQVVGYLEGVLEAQDGLEGNSAAVNVAVSAASHENSENGSDRMADTHL